MGDLNTRPPHYECDALPAELMRHTHARARFSPVRCRGQVDIYKANRFFYPGRAGFRGALQGLVSHHRLIKFQVGWDLE